MAFIGIPTVWDALSSAATVGSGVTEVILFFASGQLKGLLMGARSSEHELGD